MAGRSFTEPAGLLPFELAEDDVAALLVLEAGQAHEPHRAACGRSCLRGSGTGHWQAFRAAGRRSRHCLRCAGGPMAESDAFCAHRPGGEIGRRAGLKIPFRKECRFDSDPRHQPARRRGGPAAPRSPSARSTEPDCAHASAAPGHPGPAADQRRAVLPGCCSSAVVLAPVRAVAARLELPALAGGDLQRSCTAIEHLFFNMLGLWMFGSELERLWGDAALHLLLVPARAGRRADPAARGPGDRLLSPTVGASGGLFGLLLAFGMLFPNRMIMPLIPPIPMTRKELRDPVRRARAVAGLLQPGWRRGALRAPGRHAGRLADDPLLARPGALRPAR